MSKAINLSGLKTLLEPLVHLINKKAERPDWNENDPSSPDYIENRPFYESINNGVLFEFTANSTDGIRVSPDDTYAGYSWSSQDITGLPFPFEVSDFALCEGVEYTVEYESATYDLNAACVTGYEQGIWIGNGSILNSIYGTTYEDNNLDFCIIYNKNELSMFMMRTICTAQVSISGKQPVIHKIDEKYLPESQGGNIGKAGSGEDAEIFNDYENNTASGDLSHVEGYYSGAYGFASHAEGQLSHAVGARSHAEGFKNTAEGEASHAEGNGTNATGNQSHAEGLITKASGQASHAEGNNTVASSLASHAEGSYTTASSWSSHAEGHCTLAAGIDQHVQGRCNISSDSLAHIVGNGTYNSSDSTVTSRSNAHTLDWSGNAWYAGDVYVGSTSGKNKDGGSKKLATEDYVTTLVGETPVSEQITTALEGYVKLDPNDTTISGEAALVNAGTFNGLTYDAVKSDIASAATSGMTFNSTGVNMFVGTKAIEGEITSAFRTQTKGNTTGDHYLSVVRAESGLTNVPVYGSGLAWGRWDTHGYLMTDYNTAKAYIGGGSADTLRWCKQIAFTDHTHTYSDVGAAAASHTHGQVDWGDNSTSSSTYIKNRTHYKSLSSTPYSSDTVTVTPTSQTLSFAAPSNNYAVVVECDGGISWSSSYSSRYGSYYNVYISSTDGQNHTATIKLYEYVYTKLDNRYLNSSVHTDDNLSFSLSGTTLTITKS